MKLATVLITFLCLVGTSTAFGSNDPEYLENYVLVATPVDGGMGTFQNVLNLVESMVNVEFTSKDSISFYCYLEWEEEEYDAVQKLRFESTRMEVATVEEVVAAFISLGVYAQPNYIFSVFQVQGNELPIIPREGKRVPLDPYSMFQSPYQLGGEDPQTGLRYAKVIESWSNSKGTTEIILQINDTGGLWNHPELAPNLWQNLREDANGNGRTIEFVDGHYEFDLGDENGIDDDGNGLPDDLIGWNFLEHNNDPTPVGMDPFNHGTAVGSIAGAVNFNGIGMFGVAQSPVRLQFIRCGSNGWIDAWAGIQSLGYAIETNLRRGSHVIANISWGSLYPDHLLEHQVECFVREGGLPGFAAGNYGDSRQTFPAAYHFGPIVTATNQDNVRASWSSFGDWLWPDGLSAPGEEVLVMQANFYLGQVLVNFVTNEGTSFSAPLVSGAAANLWSMYPDMTNAELKSEILSSIYKPENYPQIDPDPWMIEDYYGKGIIDAADLMQYGP
jgi:subtilisin family serine protease